MNAAMSNYEDQNFDYGHEEQNPSYKGKRPSMLRRAQNVGRRRGKGLSQVNGIHRRRRKRLQW